MTTEGYHKKSFGSYIDDIPDLVWIKDLEQRYTYVNKAFIDMAGIESNNILGKNDSEIGEYLEENDINYSFSMGNFRNDSQVSIFSKPRLIIETGIIDGRFAALQVYKKPLYNSDITSARKHVGYIGIGRDLTYDVEDHNMMSEFIAEERIEEALKLFEIHKNRYQTT
jgi:PAS domain S-box-containing protein